MLPSHHPATPPSRLAVGPLTGRGRVDEVTISYPRSGGMNNRCMVRLRSGYIGFGVLGALLALTGCAAPGVADTVERGAPDNVDIDPLSGKPAAAWIERGERFAIVTLGSSSCPPVATSISADGDDRIAVTFGPSPNDPCTADIAPTTHTFEVPEGVDPSGITIEVSYEEWPEVHQLTLE